LYWRDRSLLAEMTISVMITAKSRSANSQAVEF